MTILANGSMDRTRSGSRAEKRSKGSLVLCYQWKHQRPERYRCPNWYFKDRVKHMVLVLRGDFSHRRSSAFPPIKVSETFLSREQVRIFPILAAAGYATVL